MCALGWTHAVRVLLASPGLDAIHCELVVLDAAVASFIDGLHAGSRVVAVATLLGAVVAAIYLPARPDAAPETDQVIDRT